MMGSDSISPFCAGESRKVSLMNGAIAPLSTQMQQEKAKYKNAANRVGAWPARRKVLKLDMALHEGMPGARHRRGAGPEAHGCARRCAHDRQC
jgi:hypothetical protein